MQCSSVDSMLPEGSPNATSVAAAEKPAALKAGVKL